MTAPPLLLTPEPKEPLMLYLAPSEHAVSAALLRVRDTEQVPVYYVSKSLLSAETRYLPLEKLVLALLIASRKLPHYFEGHPTVLYTEFPLKALLQKADFSGRISTWSVELSQYEIDYQPRMTIKGQVLADFVADFSPSALPPPLDEGPKEGNPKSKKGKVVAKQKDPSPEHDPEEWRIYVDGSACNKGSRVGVVIFSPEGLVLERAIRLGFSASNNVAEYEALLAG